MKYIKQIMIILLISFLGELLNTFIPIPVPATVWGMCLMFIALLTKIVKLEAVEETADFLVSIIAMLFVPYAVSLMASFGLLAEYALPIMLIMFVSFVICFAAAGKTVDLITSLTRKKEDLAK